MIRPISALIVLAAILTSCQSSSNFSSTKYRKGFRYTKFQKAQNRKSDIQKDQSVSFRELSKNQIFQVSAITESASELERPEITQEKVETFSQLDTPSEDVSDEKGHNSEHIANLQKVKSANDLKPIKEHSKKVRGGWESYQIVLGIAVFFFFSGVLLLLTWLILYIFMLIELAWVFLPLSLMGLGLVLAVVSIFFV